MKTIKIYIWDKPDCGDRYTIAITGLQEINGVEYVVFLAASENPYHPQGVGQYCKEVPDEQFSTAKYRHLGKRVGWYDVPKRVREFILQEME